MRNLIVVFLMYTIIAIGTQSCANDTTSCAYKVRHQKKAIKAKQKVVVQPYYVRVRNVKN